MVESRSLNGPLMMQYLHFIVGQWVTDYGCLTGDRLEGMRRRFRDYCKFTKDWTYPTFEDIKNHTVPYGYKNLLTVLLLKANNKV